MINSAASPPRAQEKEAKTISGGKSGEGTRPRAHWYTAAGVNGPRQAQEDQGIRETQTYPRTTPLR